MMNHADRRTITYVVFPEGGLRAIVRGCWVEPSALPDGYGTNG